MTVQDLFATWQTSVQRALGAQWEAAVERAMAGQLTQPDPTGTYLLNPAGLEIQSGILAGGMTLTSIKCSTKPEWC